MTVYWPDNAKQTFGTEILRADHAFDQSDLFSDDGLAELLDDYPRNELEIWSLKNGHRPEGQVLRGRAPHLSGAEIIDAVKAGNIWLNLRRANDELGALQSMADEAFNSLEAAADRKAKNRDVSLLISSPNVDISYHLNIACIALFQLRGRKRLWVYPNDAEFAPPEHVERTVNRSLDDNLPYRREFDTHARLFDLKPGMGLTWPLFAPHRVENGNCLNVSMSCEFMTTGSAIQSHAVYTNALLRNAFNLSPTTPSGVGPITLAKAALASFHKSTTRQAPQPAKAPVTFELDGSVKNCVKPLWA